MKNKRYFLLRLSLMLLRNAIYLNNKKPCLTTRNDNKIKTEIKDSFIKEKVERKCFCYQKGLDKVEFIDKMLLYKTLES